MSKTNDKTKQNLDVDDKIKQLFEVVGKQRDEVAKAEKESKQSWKTKCVCEFNSYRFNIQTAKEEEVIQIVKTLLVEKKYLQEAHEVLNLPFSNTISGFSFEDWFTDCQKRISVIQLKQKKDKLAELENRLQAIVSPEQKRLMELERISASLGVDL